ncbi:MAG: hypothetical protein WC099_00925 [Candidatus Paceibacterota bacterium]
MKESAEYHQFDNIKEGSVIMVPGTMGYEVVLKEKPIIQNGCLTVAVKSIIDQTGRQHSFLLNKNKEWILDLKFNEGENEWQFCGNGSRSAYAAALNSILIDFEY